MGRRCDFQCALVPALRRAESVLLIAGEDRAPVEVCGIGCRYPVTVAVSMGLAARLAGAGALMVRVERSAKSPKVLSP